MAIDPRISLGVQQLQLNDPLTQYGQVQNILAAQSQRQAAGTQNELAQAQLGQARTSMRQAQEARDTVTKIMGEIGKHGGPADPMEAATRMLQDPRPEVQATGDHLLTSYQKVLAYQQDIAFTNRNAPKPPPAAAPSVADLPVYDTTNRDTKSDSTVLRQNALKTPVAARAPLDEAMMMDFVKNAAPNVTYDDFVASKAEGLAAPVAAPTPVVTTPLQAPGVTPAPRVNNLPAAAPAEAATTNALATPSKADQIRAKIIDLQTNFPYSAKAKEQITFLNKELEQLTKAYTVGSNLVSGEGKEIYTGKVKETDSDFEKLLAKTNLTEDEKKAMRLSKAKKDATHAPGVSVSYGPQEKEEKKEYGKLLIDDFKGVKAQATVAAKSLPAIESNLATLDKGFDTGFGTETIAAGARVLGALGVEKAEDFATNAQTFLASANAAVLQRQLEQKGPQTESDAQRITATGAQLGNTKEANRFVLNVAKAQLQRDIEQRTFYAKWRDKNKTFEGAEDAWFAGPGGKSLFDNPALKKYAVPTETIAAPVKDNRPPLTEIFKIK
jgi:hypothetical protein